MDDCKQPAKGTELPSQGPHYSRPCDPEPPSAFIPLKLILQPNGPVLELTRPDTLMGRHSEANVRLPLPDVSRRHCRFLFTDGAWQILDLDSLNGVFVNGERVQNATLYDRDVVGIGGFRFEVELSSSPSTAGDPGSSEGVIHSIAEALPRPAPDVSPQRKAS